MVVRLYSYELKTTHPRWPLRKGLLLQWNMGWGEIAPLPGFSRETIEEAQKEIESLLPSLSRGRHIPSSALPSVQFAIASASRPFSRAPLRIPLALLNDPLPGFSILKLKLGHLSVADAVNRVRKVKDSHRLRLDCNRAWSLDEALAFARHFTPTDFEYLEEPLRTYSELIQFANITHFPIALDESIAYGARSEIPTLKAIIIKPTIVGSIPALPVPTVLSSAFESSVGLLQIARLFKPHGPVPGLDTFRFFQDDLLVPPLKAENGFLTWPGTVDCPVNVKSLAGSLVKRLIEL